MLRKTRNIFVFLGLSIVSSTLFSQQSKDTAKNTVVEHKILLVPFKPTMLMSEIGKAVNASTHLSYKKIVAAFRYRMDLALYNTFKKAIQPFPTFNPTKKEIPTLHTFMLP